MEIPKAFRTSTTLKHEPASSHSGMLLIYRQHEWSWFIGIIDLTVCKISTGGFAMHLSELLLCWSILEQIADSRVHEPWGLCKESFAQFLQYYSTEGALGTSVLCKALLDGKGYPDYSAWGIEENCRICKYFDRFHSVLNTGLCTAAGWEVLPQ